MKKAIIALFATSENLKFLLWGITILVLIIIIFMAIPPYSSIFMYIAGEKAKLELIKFVGWGISGLIAIFGVIGLLQRATALDKQNEMTEKGHIHERFKVATEHLGNKESGSVRIAAFNEFYHVAEIEPDLRQPIFDILCAHLRQITKDKKELDVKQLKEIKPTEEVRSLLNILFKPDNKDKFIFVGMIADLEGANLQYANLKQANLQYADLCASDIKCANLDNAELQNAFLLCANLQYTGLNKANLHGAGMWLAKLQGASMQEANLYKANLHGANLQDANLQGANLQEAKITQKTTMPNGWEDSVKKDDDNKTGVLLVDDKEKIIKYL